MSKVENSYQAGMQGAADDAISTMNAVNAARVNVDNVSIFISLIKKAEEGALAAF